MNDNSIFKTCLFMMCDEQEFFHCCIHRLSLTNLGWTPQQGCIPIFPFNINTQFPPINVLFLSELDFGPVQQTGTYQTACRLWPTEDFKLGELEKHIPGMQSRQIEAAVFKTRYRRVLDSSWSSRRAPPLCKQEN